MNIDMTFEEYYAYVDSYFKEKMNKIYDMVEEGSYQRKIIDEYNNKHSFLSRLADKSQEAEYIKLCKKSMSNNYMTYRDARQKIEDQLISDLRKEADDMRKNYERQLLIGIDNQSKGYNKEIVDRIIVNYYDKFENIFKKNNEIYLTVTETAILSADFFIFLRNIGMNPINDYLSRAGLATAVLIELGNRLYNRYNKKVYVRFSSDFIANPQASQIDAERIRQGYYKMGSKYINMQLTTDPLSNAFVIKTIE